MRGLLSALLMSAFLVHCTSDPEPCEGEACGDSSIICGTAADCNDGVFCNGTETCAPDSESANTMGCVAGDPPCPAASCDEAAGSCDGVVCADADGDGSRDVACGGDDCDDADPDRFPGNSEVCDVDDKDEDCDPSTTGFRDNDSDGFPDSSCCNMDGSELRCGSDCDDSVSIAHPGAPEACDGLDNDCDSNVDEGVVGMFYEDTDGDGHGSSASDAQTMVACFAPDGFVDSNDDCDDSNSGVNPGLRERCDAGEVDENCDGITNPDELCTCSGDSSRACVELDGECAKGRQVCIDGSWSACSIAPRSEICNDLDDDCDGTADNGVTIRCYADTDNDGYAESGAPATDECSDPSRGLVGGCPNFTTNREPLSPNLDCDESAPGRNPGATDVCDGVDNDCDNMIDEGVAIICYGDNDNDGYPGESEPLMRCPDPSRGFVGGCPTGTTNRVPSDGLDCADSDSTINPAAVETCELPAVDENCDGMANPASDCDCSDGSVRPCPQPGVCGDGVQSCTGGAWGTCSQLPGPEACDGLDNDCDGIVDNGETFACQLNQTQSCTTDCGTPGTATCNITCTEFGACVGPEVCNNCDDDGDGVRDDTFLCRQGEIGVACTTGCLTSGFGTCNATCDGAVGCEAPSGDEACNYCDDDGDGTTLGEEPRLSRAFLDLSCGALTMLGAATCTDVGDRPPAGPPPTIGEAIDIDLTTTGATDSVGGAWVTDPFIMGHEPFSMSFQIECTNPAATLPSFPGAGFALLFATSDEPVVGAGLPDMPPSSNFWPTGVPTADNDPNGMRGVAIEVKTISANSMAAKARFIRYPRGRLALETHSVGFCETAGATESSFWTIYYLPRRNSGDDDQIVLLDNLGCGNPYDEGTCPSIIRVQLDDDASRIAPGDPFLFAMTGETTDYAPGLKLRELSGFADLTITRDGLCGLPGTTRIVGDSGSGRLEVLHDGAWGTICSDSFDDVDADVACRQLGYAGGTSLTSVPRGVGQTWMDEVACTGSESSIEECTFGGWGIEDCDHDQDVGVTCTP